jgi:hypothetical protein
VLAFYEEFLQCRSVPEALRHWAGWVCAGELG